MSKTTTSQDIIKFKVMDAINESKMPAMQRYVLFQFWHMANAYTGDVRGTWSYEKLAEIMGLCEKTVRVHVNQSVKEKWLERTTPKKIDAIHKHYANRYRCLVPWYLDMNGITEVITPPVSATGSHDRENTKALFVPPVSATGRKEIPTGSVKDLSVGAARSADAARSAGKTKNLLHEKKNHAPAAGQDRDPLVCMTCNRKLWDCSCQGSWEWVCTCGKQIWLDFNDGETYSCKSCGELASGPFTHVA